MKGRFEFFVARRYLQAKRKQAVISLITVISVIGVAAGVMALVVSLAINNGFRSTLQKSLLSAYSHVNIIEKEQGYGIENWRELIPRLRRLRHVIGASPTLYGPVSITAAPQMAGAVLKGIRTDLEVETSDMLRRLKYGSLDSLNKPGAVPGIVLGARLAESLGARMGSIVWVMSPQGPLTPYGMTPGRQRFRVAGIFETGMFDIDDTWAFTSLKASQQLLSVGDVVNVIELKLDDIYQAPEVAQEAEKIVGTKLAATTWMEQNHHILNALKMEKAVTVVTIGLIVLVAALNILITLVMMVMEKHRDIAILVSMGARASQIRRIFIFQGVLIGVFGSAIGLATGQVLCFLADKYRWIRLDAEVYALSYVPFNPRWLDSVWIAAMAILISYLATIYPARNASRLAPAEALRYE